MTIFPEPHADIAAWLEQHTRAWNADDPAAMFERAAPDLHWVNVVGMHWQGRDQALVAHRAFFARMFAGVPLHLVSIESVTAITEMVRIAVVRWRLGAYTIPSGVEISDEQNRMTLVFSGAGDALQLRHVANVRIDPDAAPHDPVHRAG